MHTAQPEHTHTHTRTGTQTQNKLYDILLSKPHIKYIRCIRYKNKIYVMVNACSKRTRGWLNQSEIERGGQWEWEWVCERERVRERSECPLHQLTVYILDMQWFITFFKLVRILCMWNAFDWPSLIFYFILPCKDNANRNHILMHNCHVKQIIAMVCYLLSCL